MFLGQIEKMDWQMECDASVPYRAMTVQVGFSHAENEMDETEFCVNAYDAKELTELFEGFCKENGFKDVSVESISVVRVAATLDELTKMEEMEMTIKAIEDYFDSVNLGHYGLDGCEITDDDFQVIAEKMENPGDRLEIAVDEYLKGIREVLDEGLEEELDYEEAFSGNEKKSLEEIIAGVEEKQEKGPRKAVKEIGREEMRL